VSRKWIPVLVAAALLSPWPILALGIRPALQRDLAVVPTDGPTLMANVAPAFSRCRYYLIIDLGTGSVRPLENPFRNEPHAAGLRGAYLLLQQHVGLALATRVGPEPFNNLTARGVVVYGGARGTARDAIEQYVGGRLTRLSAPTAPVHYGIERQQRKQQQAPPPSGPVQPAALGGAPPPFERL
jgi:predicted Fe-Mo cluster-binding NifX family protein